MLIGLAMVFTRFAGDCKTGQTLESGMSERGTERNAECRCTLAKSGVRRGSMNEVRRNRRY
jgi:hypothetical protein